jgi:hypothetical protein
MGRELRGRLLHLYSKRAEERRLGQPALPKIRTKPGPAQFRNHRYDGSEIAGKRDMPQFGALRDKQALLFQSQKQD